MAIINLTRPVRSLPFLIIPQSRKIFFQFQSQLLSPVITILYWRILFYVYLAIILFDHNTIIQYGHNRSYIKCAPLCATLPDGPRNYDASLDSSKGIEEILMLAWV